MKRVWNTFTVVVILLGASVILHQVSGGDFLKMDLANVNSVTYSICQNLISHPTVVEKDAKFYVVYNPIDVLALELVGGAAMVKGTKQILFSPRILNHPDFELIAAHEIGHIEVGLSQHDADLFALRLLGNQKINFFVKNIKNWGRSDQEIQQILNEFDAKYTAETSTKTPETSKK